MLVEIFTTGGTFDKLYFDALSDYRIGEPMVGELLQQARVNEAQSLYNYLNALARLERVSGGEIPLVDARLPGGD